MSLRILQALVAGTDEPEENMAQRLSLSVASLQDRIRSLERKRIITGYDVRPSHSGAEALVFMDIAGPAATLASDAVAAETVRAIYCGPGPYALVARMTGPDVPTLVADAETRFQRSGYVVQRIRPLATAQPATRGSGRVRRATVDLGAIGVEQHAIIIGQTPADRRDAVLTALAAHPVVVSCRAFLAEPLEIMLEVAAPQHQSLHDFADWSRDVCSLEIQEYLPIERVLHGGPDGLPQIEF